LNHTSTGRKPRMAIQEAQLQANGLPHCRPSL
jgi:hypothetical protein